MTIISTFEQAIQSIDALKSCDEKISFAIMFMKEAISSDGKPRFKDFWKMKKCCFELFKMEGNHFKKSFFWKEYANLLKEAESLQEIFKEESDFHQEQIKLAIAGIEDEVCNQEKWKSISIPVLNYFPELNELEQKGRFFERLKTKVIALREEILALEIRVHLKNELLNDLKKVGDLVFPEYKKIVIELTNVFTKRADTFFDIFEKRSEKRSYKKEIREFQALLKELHISHDSYRQFRERFSKAWKLDEVEKPQIGATLNEKATLNELEGSYQAIKKVLSNGLEKKQAISLENQLLVLKESMLRKNEGSQSEFAALNKETKVFLDKLKKELHSCGLDFEFAKSLTQLIEENKKRLSSL